MGSWLSEPWALWKRRAALRVDHLVAEGAKPTFEETGHRHFGLVDPFGDFLERSSFEVAHADRFSLCIGKLFEAVGQNNSRFIAHHPLTRGRCFGGDNVGDPERPGARLRLD